jgi:hypothetical protein
MKPLEERRARAIVARVIEESGKSPKPGRTFEMAGGYKLIEDARIGGSPYGIAYITEEEREAAGEQLPRYDPDSTVLRIVRPSDGAVVLVLHDLAYRFDARGDDNATAVTAEKTFERDVADFMVNVVATGAGRQKPKPAAELGPHEAEDRADESEAEPAPSGKKP